MMIIAALIVATLALCSMLCVGILIAVWWYGPQDVKAMQEYGPDYPGDEGQWTPDDGFQGSKLWMPHDDTKEFTVGFETGPLTTPDPSLHR